jgi:hypothetical protein
VLSSKKAAWLIGATPASARALAMAEGRAIKERVGANACGCDDSIVDDSVYCSYSLHLAGAFFGAKGDRGAMLGNEPFANLSA